MTAAVYMANTIDTDWGEMATTFNLAMLAMLLCVAMMYLVQIRLKEQDTGAARNMLTILIVACGLYLKMCFFLIDLVGMLYMAVYRLGSMLVYQ